jgi:protein-tyrosine phosphatase
VEKRRKRAWWIAGLAAAALVLALVAARPFAGPPLPDRWREARAGWLYRSAQIPPGDVEEFLRNERIDVILDLSSEEVDPLRDAEAAASRELGIRYYHLPVDRTGQGDTRVQNLAKAVAEIERAHLRGDRVWLHCAVGHRRSAAAFALYARLIEKEPPHIAYAELTRWAEPDSTWAPDMQRWIEKHYAELEAAVKAELAKPDPG